MGTSGSGVRQMCEECSRVKRGTHSAAGGHVRHDICPEGKKNRMKSDLGRLVSGSFGATRVSVAIGNCHGLSVLSFLLRLCRGGDQVGKGDNCFVGVRR